MTHRQFKAAITEAIQSDSIIYVLNAVAEVCRQEGAQEESPTFRRQWERIAERLDSVAEKTEDDLNDDGSDPEED